MSLPGFVSRQVACGAVRLSVHEAGRGDPVVLLHGFPQTHMTWHRVAPALAERFRVIVPDLRGYGASDAPADDAGHTVYSKREMAADVVGLLDALGIGRAAVVGHDRGARVAYRLALDHPDRVRRLGIIEVVPTGDFWAAWHADLALRAWHWTFLAQPAPMPERLIGGDAVAWLDGLLASWTGDGTLDAFSPAALAAYRAQIRDPARLAAMCADYRAGATTDRRLDEDDRAAGRQITAPLRFLWAEGGFPARTGDPLGLWRAWAPQVTGNACVAGHFVMEENPAAVLASFVPFLTEG
ncbi:alpha/beta fold hydrolase [Rhodobaculum claviforme]|uniref:Alpha/beta hydrolase n=1 Tax=Rhodobaculum claviforme TaxID=1549854 RepID=A0A934TN78_9RHOB|nr:alpha/beta hydrolase [Rhodobaculum claviforme]MBK5928347.1 alpha/beta hydrolase [Rhodobaculum claviforme]